MDTTAIFNTVESRLSAISGVGSVTRLLPGLAYPVVTKPALFVRLASEETELAPCGTERTTIRFDVEISLDCPSDSALIELAANVRESLHSRNKEISALLCEGSKVEFGATTYAAIAQIPVAFRRI